MYEKKGISIQSYFHDDNKIVYKRYPLKRTNPEKYLASIRKQELEVMKIINEILRKI